MIRYGLLINPFQWFTALIQTCSLPTFVLMFSKLYIIIILLYSHSFIAISTVDITH